MKKLLLLFFIFFLTSVSAEDVHPYHVGSVEISYNGKSGAFEITGRFFLDDLENALKEKYGRTVHFNDPKYREEINRLLKSYAGEYFRLKADGRFVAVSYLGFEEDREAVNIYLESAAVPSPAKVETAVSFLYNLFDDQMNIVHIIISGKRQSEKLQYPNRYLYKQF